MKIAELAKINTAKFNQSSPVQKLFAYHKKKFVMGSLIFTRKKEPTKVWSRKLIRTTEKNKSLRKAFPCI